MPLRRAGEENLVEVLPLEPVGAASRIAREMAAHIRPEVGVNASRAIDRPRGQGSVNPLSMEAMYAVP
jgi:hypothetical protein